MKILIALSLSLFMSTALAQINPPGHSQHAWPSPSTSSSSGPSVPCYGCEENPPLFDAPSSGLWENPLEPGTGFSFTVQGRSLRGTYHGYDTDGRALWYSFDGQLERPADAPRLLRLSSLLEGTDKRITLEFDQRNYGSFSIENDNRTHIEPVIQGIDSSRFFPAYADYKFPDMNGIWTLVFSNPDINDTRRSRSYMGGLVGWSQESWLDQGFFESISIDLLVNGIFGCSTTHNHTQYAYPDCYYMDSRIYPGDIDATLLFSLPYANIGANRIISVNQETGIRMQFFRLGFD